MKSFIDYLGGRGVKFKKYNYYLAWVEQYNNFCNDRGLGIFEERSVNYYLYELKRMNEEWLVRQAKVAVCYYLEWRILISKKRRYLKGFENVLISGVLSKRTKVCYLNILKRFMLFHEGVEEFGYDEVYRYIVSLSEGGSASLQNQALSCLSLFYKEVLSNDLRREFQKLRVRKLGSLPKIMSRAVLAELLEELTGAEKLMIQVMYGSGLRGGECRSLRISDLDFDQELIRVRDAKGIGKRVYLMPKSLKRSLQGQIGLARNQFEQDRARDLPGVNMTKELKGGLSCEWSWFWLFPGRQLKELKVGGGLYRPCVSEYSLRGRFVEALDKINYPELVSLDVLRHSFAVHLLEDGCHIRRVQELLGHRDLKRMMVYEKMARRSCEGVKSPLDNL